VVKNKNILLNKEIKFLNNISLYYIFLYILGSFFFIITSLFIFVYHPVIHIFNLVIIYLIISIIIYCFKTLKPLAFGMLFGVFLHIYYILNLIFALIINPPTW
jgi:hypothetical protein